MPDDFDFGNFEKPGQSPNGAREADVDADAPDAADGASDAKLMAAIEEQAARLKRGRAGECEREAAAAATRALRRRPPPRARATARPRPRARARCSTRSAQGAGRPRARPPPPRRGRGRARRRPGPRVAAESEAARPPRRGRGRARRRPGRARRSRGRARRRRRRAPRGRRRGRARRRRGRAARRHRRAPCRRLRRTRGAGAEREARCDRRDRRERRDPRRAPRRSRCRARGGGVDAATLDHGVPEMVEAAAAARHHAGAATRRRSIAAFPRWSRPRPRLNERNGWRARPFESARGRGLRHRAGRNAATLDRGVPEMVEAAAEAAGRAPRARVTRRRSIAASRRWSRPRPPPLRHRGARHDTATPRSRRG